uniref:Uncharacterized protein n=1 Tax=Populus alba TaxID=43335 RepID=A0A4U5MB32_POPAL|nr:hypothetical protein D5086_0000312490 [Populus alba]
MEGNGIPASGNKEETCSAVMPLACLRPFLLFFFLLFLCPVYFRRPADFEMTKEPRMKVSTSTDFWVVFCRDENNGRIDSPLCVVPLLFFPRLGLASVFLPLLWISSSSHVRPFSGFYKAKEGHVFMPSEMASIVEARDRGREILEFPC